ncbi:MAG TPA: nucleotidyltransferase [Candidatus Aerophobetes bacterium]|uniref:Nucleotidyltransferase n=1 Tax=Aerophobetes bacterium TaxID=2030807 RepID=A0A7V5HY00_UNCAE|nr:nucleotidyltransferase [Candidatus Aerophobetes bacterium]
MREIDRIMRILKDHKEELKRRFSLKKIGVFGSYTREEQTPESDIDIYVEFDIKNLTFDKYLELIDYLEKLLGRKIDLITKYGVETIRIPYIKEEIKRSLIYA